MHWSILRNKVTVAEMANLLNLKSVYAYYKKEEGVRRFSLEEARKISEIFEMDIGDIFSRTIRDLMFLACTRNYRTLAKAIRHNDFEKREKPCHKAGQTQKFNPNISQGTQ